MLCWILIVGGLLIMMGQHDRSEALFYYFRLEDQVPETHLLRLIDKHISFEFVRHHQRAQTGGGTAHAPCVALVHGLGCRSGNPASLHVLEKPARAVSGIEVV